MEHAISTKKYVTIWVALLGMLFVSIGFGYLKHPVLASVLIFGIAAVKIYLVLSYYMHLKFDPKWVKILLLTTLFFILFFFFMLIPDMVYFWSGDK